MARACQSSGNWRCASSLPSTATGVPCVPLVSSPIWRATVARHLGEDTKGTQGTPVAVLGKLIAQRQLPELWQARAGLVERFDAGER